MARVPMNNLRNLPVKTAAVLEGTVTKSNIIGPDGGRIDGVITRSNPVVKGDHVQMVLPASGAGITTNLIAVVEKVPATGQGLTIGRAVSDPQGIDLAATTTGDIPDVTTDAGVARLRRVDVAFFGLAIIEITIKGSSDVAQKPGQYFLGDQTASSASPTTKGNIIVLKYAKSPGDKVSVLLGYAYILSA